MHTNNNNRNVVFQIQIIKGWNGYLIFLFLSSQYEKHDTEQMALKTAEKLLKVRIVFIYECLIRVACAVLMDCYHWGPCLCFNPNN